MFYNIYRDLRVKPSIIHTMQWNGYTDRKRAIAMARYTENHSGKGILVYVKTIETISPYEYYDGIALSLREKDRMWNQTLPEVHFYDAGRTQYR